VREEASRRGFVGAAAAAFTGLAVPSRASELPSRPENARLPNLPFLSVADFGAIGTGIPDDSKAVQTAYDALKTTGGTLFFPRGRYRVALDLTSRNVHIQGEGRGATTLSPSEIDGVALQAGYREGSWDGVTISDLTISGSGRLQGVGFQAGSTQYRKDDEYSGSTYLSRVQFNNLGKCIARPRGSIGLWADGCQFGPAEYHFWGRGILQSDRQDAMHGGCLVVSRCHMDGFTKAMFYIDSPTGDSGQIIFENNIFEGGSGFVAYVRSFNNAAGEPGILFRSNWNENTATGKKIEIEGKVHTTARFLYARNVPSAIRFEDTPLGSVELVASGIETANCSLQNMVAFDADPASTITHENARLFSGTSPGVVNSIAKPTNDSGLRTPWFRMAPPFIGRRIGEGAVLMMNDGAHPLSFTGSYSVKTSTVGNQGLLFTESAQRLALSREGTVSSAPVIKLSGNGWLITAYLYKMLEGASMQIAINGSVGLTGIGTLSSRKWEMLLNISRYETNKEERIAIYHMVKDPAAMLIGGVALVSFRTLQDALDFANSRVFPS
jgi:Pectate lyase superfamily protein